MISHRYSQHARGALNRARALAKQCAHAYLDSTHLLLGILYEEGSVGCNILHDLQFDLRRTERAFRQLPRAADWATTPDATAGLQDALFQAARESHGLGQKYVGTEHLLLGMIRQGETLFMSMLHTLDVNPEQIRRRVQRLVQAGITEIDFEQAKRIARLSELSRRVLYGAEQMASSLGHSGAGLPHLLLVLARERRSICARILSEHRLDQTALEADLAAMAAPEPAVTTLDDLIDQAVDRAESFGSHYTGTEHLLLSLVHDPRGARLLSRYGVQPGFLAQQMRDYLIHVK